MAAGFEPPGEVKVRAAPGVVRGDRPGVSTWLAVFTRPGGSPCLAKARLRHAKDGEITLIDSTLEFNWRVSGAELKTAKARA